MKLDPAPPHLGFSSRSFGMLFLLMVVTGVSMSLIFAPRAWWPLAYVCLAPWAVGAGVFAFAPWVYVGSLLLGYFFFLYNLQWLQGCSGPYYYVLPGYLALYFPLAACPLRHAVRRRRLPLALVLPVVWTGTEMLRAVVITGFPWFFLGHSHYAVLPLIQVADLTGVYGVTFVIAAVNGAIADVVLARLSSGRSLTPSINRRHARFGLATAVLLLAANLAYGVIQLQRSQRLETDGPRVAVLQGDHINVVNGENLSDEKRSAEFFNMMLEAVRQKPDLILLPESAWGVALNPEFLGMKNLRGWSEEFRRFSEETYRGLQEMATKHNMHIVIGAIAYEPTPFSLRTTERRYNSAYVFYPDGRQPPRYDKNHLVYFGEIVPFRFGRFRWLYFWLNAMDPFSEGGSFEFSAFPGHGFTRFAMEAASQPGRVFHFGIPICYEDVMPYVSRRFAMGSDNEKGVDFLCNISNDGWFGHGAQQAQHLAICTFRAVENRVGIARSVNTGGSAFIAPTGRQYNIVRPEGLRGDPHRTGFEVATIRVDPRLTVYTRRGDLLGWACVWLGAMLYLDYFWCRARRKGPA